MLARFWMVHSGSVGGRTQSNQHAQGENRTHRTCSGCCPLLINVVLATTVSSSCRFTSDQIGEMMLVWAIDHNRGHDHIVSCRILQITTQVLSQPADALFRARTEPPHFRQQPKLEGYYDGDVQIDCNRNCICRDDKFVFGESGVRATGLVKLCE
jgi:hypothetical protein